jgi:hypothetical protein
MLKALARLGVLVAVVLASLAATAGGEPDPGPPEPELLAYWLGAEDRGYVDLVLTWQPLWDLVEAEPCTAEHLLECPALRVSTYEKDSLWNTDLRPFKPLTGVTDAGADYLTVDGTRYLLEHASLEEVLELLKNPEGTVSIHRIFGPVMGQEEFVEALAAKILQQLTGS